MSAQRALAAVMFTDAVSFSSHVGRDEEQALREIEEDFALMRDQCSQNGGQVLKSMGDGMLMVFLSAQNATTCAIEIQRRLGQKAWTNVGNPLLHRIGIHLCDVLLTETDAHGDGVNVAARLEREAPPGGIAMSQATYDVVRGKLPVRANFVGERYLRNIIEPVRIWEIPPVFAPTADQIEEAQTSRADRNRQKEAAKGNPAMVVALVFVGACVLFAAGVIWFKSNAPAAVQSEPSQVSVEDAAPPNLDAPPKNGEPAPIVSRPLRVGPDPSKPKPDAGDDDAPQTMFTEEQAEAKAAYDQMREQLKPEYQFDQMLAWLEAQSWSKTPLGKRVAGHWQRLLSFRSGVEAAIAARSAASPLEFRANGGVAKIWLIQSGQFGVLWPNGQQDAQPITQLPPATLFEVGKAALESDPGAKAWSRAFAREYGLTPD